MSLINEVLSEERRVLSRLGCDLNEQNADKNYPDTYYIDYSLNLFLEMDDRHKGEYGGGSGGELYASGKTPAKMASIRSSSAMTFNLLGNNFIYLLPTNGIGHPPGKYRIEYEKQHETIKSRNGQQPANLDAFLESEDGSEVIFCEMKMLEWFSKNNSQLKSAYRDESNYTYPDLFASFLSTIENIENRSKAGAFEYYDVWQMFKHTLAIHNFMRTYSERNFRKITLLNVVFEPGDSFMSEKAKREYIIQRDKEHIGFEGFRAALVDTGIIGDGNIFDVKYFSVKDFMENFEMSDAKARYLSRYVLEE